MSLLLTDRWFELPAEVIEHPTIVPMKQKLVNAYGTGDVFTIVAGRRSYKTETGKRVMAYHCTQHDNAHFHIGAPTWKQAKKIFWADMQQLIHPIFIKRISSTDLTIELTNGTALHIIGLKEFRREEGGFSDGALFSEFQECDPEVYTQSFEPMLNDRDGFAIFEGRPLGKNHLYDFYMKGVDGIDGFHSFHWTSETVLSARQIGRAKARLGIIDYRREYLADFETGGLSPYYAFSEQNYKHFDKFNLNSVIVACDFNATTKPMSWVVGFRTGSATVWIKALSYQNTNTKTMCEILEEYLKGIGFLGQRGNRELLFYGDYSGKNHTSNSSYSDWEIIENHFINLVDKFERRTKRTRSIRDSIGATNAQLCNANGERRQFVIQAECQPLIEDWRKCLWKDNNRELDDSDDLRGHCCRAVDYYNDYEFPIKGVAQTTSGSYA